MYSFTKQAPSSQIQHTSPTGKMPELVSFSVRFLEALPVLSESILNTSTARIPFFTIIFILAPYTCHHPGHVYCFSGTVVVMCLAPAPSSFLLEVLPFSIFRPATFSSHHVLLVQAELDALMHAPPCTFT